jgi:spermidine/putrescine transport system substrate-binding protein
MKTLKVIFLGLVGLVVFYGLRQDVKTIKTVEAALTAEDAPGGDPTTLRVLVRHGYFSPGVMQQAQTGLNVAFEVTYYRNDDECWQLLETGDAWDLMLVADHIALRLDRLNRTADINYEQIPNHHNMVHGQSMAPEMGVLLRCSVPLFYTSIGIGYDASLVGSIPLSWAALFEPANAALVRGHLGLLNDARRTLGIALISLGKSPNTRDPADIRQAAERVRQCMALLATMDRSAEYSHGGAAYLAQLVSQRKLVLTMITAAEMSRAMQVNPALRFTSPNEGTLLCLDALVIPQNSKQRARAEAVINFLLSPRISARLTNESGHATTNQAATGYFDPWLYHGPAFAAPTGRQFFFLQDVGDAEMHYRTVWLDLMAYYQTQVIPVLDRGLGFRNSFIESNDPVP